MKKIKISKTEYDLCESGYDINYRRFVMFKQYAPMIWEKMDSPLFEVYFDRVKEYFDRGEHTQGFIELLNYKAAINNLENGHDAWSICFALICLEPGEDQTVLDEATLQKKIKKMMDEGLTADQVYDSVTAFLTAFPAIFPAHLEMLALMGAGKVLPDTEK